jgi:serine/threonine protein kinase
MKMSAFETTALPPGSTVGPATIVDSLGFDHQTCVYRADVTGTGTSIVLYEYLPTGLAIRGPRGIEAVDGKAEVFARAQAAYTTRLRAASLVGHPALPTIVDIWQEQGTVYASGPWRPGRSLQAEVSSRNGPIDSATLGAWVRALCDALASLHQHELVHGNLSLGMIRVLDTGELLLPPVGNGMYADDVPHWIAPEQHPLNQKPAPVGPWTDIYQLSAVLLQVLTGQPPPTVVRRWRGEAPFDRLAELSGRYPDDLLLTIKRGLAMQVTTRPQSTWQWLAEAGFPDRREHARYDPHEPQPTLPEMAREGHSPTSRPADLGDVPFKASAPLPLTPNSGHLPMRQSVEERLERAELQRSHRGTPGWVWAAALVALAAVVGIVVLA